MEEGIDSLSLNPDTVVQTWLGLAELKNKFALTGPIPGSDAGDFFTGVRLSGVVMRRAKKKAHRGRWAKTTHSNSLFHSGDFHAYKSRC